MTRLISQAAPRRQASRSSVPISDAESLIATQLAITARDAGYRAAEAWWADFLVRMKDADGYFAPNRLNAAYKATPVDQRPAFIDAIGHLMVTWKVVGEPADTPKITAGWIGVESMSKHEQDSLPEDWAGEA